MRLGDEPAQVRIPLGCLGKQRYVRPVEQRQLRARDRLQAERLRFLRERHRAVQAIVVGEGERRIPELRGRERELLGERSAVEKREGGVAVELDVHVKSRKSERGTLKQASVSTTRPSTGPRITPPYRRLRGSPPRIAERLASATIHHRSATSRRLTQYVSRFPLPVLRRPALHAHPE